MTSLALTENKHTNNSCTITKMKIKQIKLQLFNSGNVHKPVAGEFTKTSISLMLTKAALNMLLKVL